MTTRVLRSAVKAAAVAADVLRPPGRGIVVLLYHRVGRRTPMPVDLPTSLFDEQIAMLTSERRVVTLDAALASLAEFAGSRPDPVVLTFDDGTADFAEVAMPILEKYQAPATLYVATDFIERQQTFPWDGQPLSWAALADTVSTGLVTVGSHTHTHRLLDRVGPEDAEREFRLSSRLIEDRLGAGGEHFAYPKALLASPAVEPLVRAHFSSAAVSGGTPNPYRGTDRYRLARTPLQVADGMHWFARKARGGMAFEDALRRRLGKRRYAGAVT